MSDWMKEFRDWLAPGPQMTAANALLPFAGKSPPGGPLEARSMVSEWEKQWYEARRRGERTTEKSRQKLRMTARSYASRLRVALTEFATGLEVL